MRRSYLWLPLLVLASCGPRQPELVLGRRAVPIVGGDYDTNPAHAAVVAIMDNYGLCTGTLISPEVVLTAAHCAQSAVSRYTVYFGSSVYNSTSRAVAEKLIHPQYDADNIVNDIALLRLVGKAPAYVSPIANLPERLGISPLDQGADLEFVGFGEDERGNSMVKLTVHNQLDWICTSAGGCSVGPGYYAAANTICQDQSPGGPCSGDSGGPAFIVREGREYVAGITSYGDEDCRYYGCSTKVDEFEQFIVGFVGGELGAPCSADDMCNSGHCTDGVCCESECSGECRGCNVGGQWGHCVPLPDGAACPDGNLCNGDETCQQGQCQPGQPLDCHVANRCVTDSCDPQQGCVYTPLADGTPCPNGNVCDGQESCRDGVCQYGEALDCDDHNPCTEDSCDPASGCHYPPRPDGSDCGGGACGPATCLGGYCLPQDESLCDDGDPCTADSCDPASGCDNRTLPDGYACGQCLMCRAGQCVEAPDCSAGGCGCGTDPTGPGYGLEALLLLLLLAAMSLPGRRRE